MVSLTALLLLPIGPLRDGGKPTGECVQVDDPLESISSSGKEGWIGGDGALSVDLGDGRSLWLFGDSRVRESRRGEGRFVRNAAVVVEGDTWRLLPLDGRHAFFDRASAVPAPASRSWLWPSHGAAAGDSVWVFLSGLRQSGPGAMQFAYERTWLARLARSRLAILSLEPWGGPAGVMWGVWVLRRQGRLYVYGIEHRPSHSDYLHVARTTAIGRRSSWRFWDGRRWSREPRRSARIAAGMGDQVSILEGPDELALVTIRGISHPRLLTVQTARAPEGPWRSRAPLALPAPRTAGAAAYGASAHPELERDGGRIVVSYSEWLPDGGSEAARQVRPPRFVAIRRECLGL